MTRDFHGNPTTRRRPRRPEVPTRAVAESCDAADDHEGYDDETDQEPPLRARTSWAQVEPLLVRRRHGRRRSVCLGPPGRAGPGRLRATGRGGGPVAAGYDLRRSGRPTR